MLDVTFASVKYFSVVGGPFLDTCTPIEACVIVSPACDVLDFALQSGVTLGTGAVHSVVVQLLFERKFVGYGINAGVGSKFSMTVSTDTIVVTIKIACPVVRVNHADDQQ